MADARETMEVVDDAITKTGVETDAAKKKTEPFYKVMGDSKIAVGKGYGKLWQSRRDQAKKYLEENDIYKAWEAAIKYFLNSQDSHRSDGPADMDNTRGKSFFDSQFNETENLVFANTVAVVPALFTKVPDVKIMDEQGTDDPIRAAFSTSCERLLDRLLRGTNSPSLNLKERLRRNIVMSTLTNESWLQLDWVMKGEAQEEVLVEIEELSSQLSKAKDQKTIEEIEGKLQAIDRIIDLTEPMGPKLRTRSGMDVLVDPACQNHDLSDANWVMYSDHLLTSFLKAKYYKKKGSDWVLAYAPTHTVKNVKTDPEKDALDSIFEPLTDEVKKAMGVEYDKSIFTKVWFVWDKTTRRVFLYNDQDWTWPIWVWDDPYKTTHFFNLFLLKIYPGIRKLRDKGEVNYYLDQQDQINFVNSTFNRMRYNAATKILYDSSIFHKDDDLEFFVGDPNKKTLGVKNLNDRQLPNIIMGFPGVGAQYMQLFDKTQLYQAIDRVSSANDVLRGGQFKTNTTNQAIDQYNQVQGVRTDDKIDLIEDHIAEIAFALLEMCIQFYKVPDIEKIIGPLGDAAAVWNQIDIQTFRSTFNLRIVGGSSEKPNSPRKRQDAIEIVQALGQFKTPAIVPLAIKVLSRAFDNEVVIEKQEWDALLMQVQMEMGMGPAGQPSPGGPPAGAPAQPDPSGQVPPQGEMDGLQALINGVM